MRIVWDPEQALADEHPAYQVITVVRLPAGQLGRTLYQHALVEVLDGQAPRQRRSTLAHEYVHVCRGPVPRWLTPREERAVEATAARLLIPFEDLVDAMVWCRDEHELAEHLHVDVPMVRARLDNLTDDENARIGDHVDEHRLSLP